MPARRAQMCGCGRGVFGLIDWTTPLRRPAALISDVPTSPGVTSPKSVTSPFSPFPISPGNAVGSWADAAESPSIQKFISGDRLIVKYSYTANKDSPLDLPELNVHEEDIVQFISFHADNKLWSCVCDSNGKEGYVPSDYLMIMEENTKSLPWLPKQAEVQQEGKTIPPVFCRRYCPWNTSRINPPIRRTWLKKHQNISSVKWVVERSIDQCPITNI